MSSGHLIIEDPYVKGKIRDLRKFLKRLSLKSVEGSVVSEREFDKQTFTYDDQIYFTASVSPDQVFTQLHHKINRLSDNVTEQTQNLADIERMIGQLPQYSWCRAIKRDLETPKKKMKIKQQLSMLEKKLNVKQEMSPASLKNISVQFQKVTRQLEEVLDADKDTELKHQCDELTSEITEKQKEIFKENPVLAVESLCSSQQPDIENVLDLLSVRKKIRNNLIAAETFAAIELDPVQRKEYRKTLSTVKKAYDSVTEWLLLNAHNFDDDLLEEVLHEFSLDGFDTLQNKKVFVAHLREVLKQQSFFSFNEGRMKLQEQLILFILRNAQDLQQFTKGILLMKHPPLKRLSVDNQKIVAESLYHDDASRQIPDHSLDEIKARLQPYIDKIEHLMTNVNQALTTDQLIPFLQETQADKEAGRIDHHVARQIMLKAAIKPYRSLKRLQDDIHKAQMGNALLEKERDHIPFLYTKKTEDGYAFYFCDHGQDEDDQLEKLYIRAKQKENTNTLTLIE